MIVKVIEIRDRHTYIPAVAMQVVPVHVSTLAIGQGRAAMEAQRALYGSVGFRDGRGVILMRLNNQEAHSDPFDWQRASRTMHTAHLWLEQHFDEVLDGQVIDVEFILGETSAPKQPQRLEDVT